MSWDILDTAGNVTGTVVESAGGFGPVGWFVIIILVIIAWCLFIQLYTFGVLLYYVFLGVFVGGRFLWRKSMRT